MDGFLQIELPPVISVFPRFNLLQNLVGCPHLELNIPIVVATSLFVSLKLVSTLRWSATKHLIHVIGQMRVARETVLVGMKYSIRG